MGCVTFVKYSLSFTLCFWANWLDRHREDIQIKLFKHILSFRMKYFDLYRWDNWWPSVSDIESIARIFGQEVYDYKWLNEDGCGAVFMFYMNWQLTWIVISQYPF
jgi:ABC-type bacteriocin/lantibiotic exporter with double-glycine peptidase domain